MEDDIYLIRLMLKSGAVLDKLTKPTAGKVLKKLIEMMKSDFMNQLFLKFTENCIINKVPLFLENKKNK
jgi:hypothetical protein